MMKIILLSFSDSPANDRYRGANVGFRRIGQRFSSPGAARCKNRKLRWVPKESVPQKHIALVMIIFTARKRPLLGGPRSSMNPTKRTVMTLIARARTAQAMHGSRTNAPLGEWVFCPLRYHWTLTQTVHCFFFFVLYNHHPPGQSRWLHRH